MKLNNHNEILTIDNFYIAELLKSCKYFLFGEQHNLDYRTKILYPKLEELINFLGPNKCCLVGEELYNTIECTTQEQKLDAINKIDKMNEHVSKYHRRNKYGKYKANVFESYEAYDIGWSSDLLSLGYKYNIPVFGMEDLVLSKHNTGNDIYNKSNLTSKNQMRLLNDNMYKREEYFYFNIRNRDNYNYIIVVTGDTHLRQRDYNKPVIILKSCLTYTLKPCLIVRANERELD